MTITATWNKITVFKIILSTSLTNNKSSLWFITCFHCIYKRLYYFNFLFRLHFHPFTNRFSIIWKIKVLSNLNLIEIFFNHTCFLINLALHSQHLKKHSRIKTILRHLIFNCNVPPIRVSFCGVYTNKYSKIQFWSYFSRKYFSLLLCNNFLTRYRCQINIMILYNNYVYWLLKFSSKTSFILTENQGVQRSTWPKFKYNSRSF